MPQENTLVGDRGVVENEFDGGKASCERVLFAEKEQVMTMLNQIATPESNTQERKRLLKGVTAALEKYLEQPHLLDPHLEDMMSVVMGRAKELVMEREAAELADAGCGSRDRPVEAFPFQVFTCPQLQDLFCVIYQLCRARGAKAVVRLMPHEAAELEPVIHALEAQDTEDHSTWETRYGLLLWLAMLSLVPFDIDTMDSGLAEKHSGGSVETEADALTEAADGGAAEEEVVLPTQAASGGRRADLVGTILSLGMKYLEDAGPTRDAAAACLSSLLTRPDMEASHLRCFLEWSSTVLERVTVEGRAGREGLSKLAFLVMGVMGTLASLFKQGHRGKLVDLIPVVFDNVVGLAELGPGQTLLRKMLVKLLQRIGTTYLPPRVVTWRYSRGQRSLLQSLAASGDKKDGNQSAPTPPEGMKEKRGDKALLPVEGDEGRDNGVALDGVNGQQQEKLREEGELPPRAEQAPEGREEDEGVEVPEELEDIVDALLCGLRDRDTVVRWSAAKGIGRITERLPHELGDDVVCSVLDLFIEAEWDGSWHGGCLALAELARRGLLLPERLPRACPLVRRALLYDVRRGAGSVGAHVRDAACYVCWAFARAYSPQVLGPHLPGLCDSMLSTALFDREVNVRRAAAAAFQENVGRQGQYGDGGLAEGAEGAEEGSEVGGVAHGIAIITAADYFSLGNRQQAYLEITTTVASFERYRRHLVDSLRLEKLHHWDPEIRNLAAAALGNAASLDPVYAAETVLPAALVNVLSPELLRRHGACLAASEITLALGKIAHPLPAETMEGLLGIVPALEKARLYRGRGGELMRQAACKVVECLALTRAEVPVKTQLRLLDSIDATLKHPLEHIQQSAVAALKAVLRNWFPAGADGPSERLQKRTIGKYVLGLRTDDNPAVARGFALALGVLPRKLAGASRAALENVLEGLKDAAVGKHGVPQGSSAAEGDSGAGGGVGSCKPRVGGSGPGGEPDAETRRNAVRALTELCEGVGVGQAGGKDEDEGSSASREVEDRSSRDNESSEERSGERSGGDLPVDSRSGWSPVRLSVEDVEGVISTLLAASEDYLVDNRGDVGSWCRMEALVGLERIARLAARASSRALPFLVDRGGGKNSGEATKASPVPFVVPALEDRLALMEMLPAPIPSPHPCDEVYLTPSMVERVLCAVLKQLSEKLDAVRERAGSVLQRIVESDYPRLPFVPEREALTRAVRGEVDASKGKAAVNWAIPSETFPIVVALLAVPEYHDAIVAGLVISVGGLTESVVKSSSNSLLRWVRACKSLGNKRSVAGLAMRLVGLLGEAKGDARVVIPLLKTVELLLSNECFDFLSAEDHPFATRLLAAVAAELKGCRDVKRVCLGASLFVCLMDYEDPARARALRSSVLLLGHRFPSVRKTTAEALYLKLLANETIVDEAVYDEVLDLLTCTEWDGDIHAARAARSELSEMLGVSVPAVGSSNAGAGDGATSSSRVEEKPRKVDELESYKSLVRSTGY